MSFENGNSKDGKHYWLTPIELYDKLNKEFNFDYDPCPYPKPEDYDGLDAEWGKSSYVNPPFGVVVHKGKKKGATAWARKCIEEHRKGKTVVMVYPIDKWVLMLLDEGAKVRNLKDVRWLSTEDKLPGKGTGRHIACFILQKEEQYIDDGFGNEYSIRCANCGQLSMQLVRPGHVQCMSCGSR
jgi:hypothetical protein